MSGVLHGTALVTGVSGAIGTAIASTLVDRGMRVIGLDVSPNGFPNMTAMLAERSDQFVGMVGDVTDEETVSEIFENVASEGRRVDLLVNNAGITRDSMIHKMSLDMWMDVLRVNLQGPFITSREMVRHIRDQKHPGRIVNISSVSAKLGNMGQANYAAAKNGLVALTKVTAREIARYGGRANAVQPGIVQSEMTGAMPEDVLKARAEAVPLGRIGQPHEIANVVAWLGSGESSYVTGAVIDSSGGRGI